MIMMSAIKARTLKVVIIPMVGTVAETKRMFDEKTMRKKIVIAIKLAPIEGDWRKVIVLRKPDSL